MYWLCSRRPLGHRYCGFRVDAPLAISAAILFAQGTDDTYLVEKYSTSNIPDKIHPFEPCIESVCTGKRGHIGRDQKKKYERFSRVFPIRLLTTRDLQRWAAAGSKPPLLSWPRQSNNDLRVFLFASARAAWGWRSYVSIGLISAPKTMHALPWGCLFPGHLFAVSLARYQLADGAPRANVDRGWHPPYSSLASPLESKYLHNHPTTSPKLVGMLTGIWYPHGVSLRREHGSMGTRYLFWCFVSCITAPNVYRSTPRISEGRRFPQYRQIDQRVRKCVTASALLSCQQNNPYTPYDTYCTRSP